MGDSKQTYGISLFYQPTSASEAITMPEGTTIELNILKDKITADLAKNLLKITKANKIQEEIESAIQKLQNTKNRTPKQNETLRIREENLLSIKKTITTLTGERREYDLALLEVNEELARRPNLFLM